MEQQDERRTEQRLRYHWPVWFAEDFDGMLNQGQMVDVSSRGAAFTCYNEGGYHYTGQNITARFSVPRFGADDSFDMTNFTRTGHVCRVEEVNPFMRRIAVQFAEALPFKPGEQAETEEEANEKMKFVTI